MEIEICKIVDILEIRVLIFITMNIKFQKIQKRAAYPSDSKSKKCLAAALGLASAISLAGCDLGTGTSGAIVNVSSSSAEGGSSSSSEMLAGVISAPSSSSVVESSSSETLTGVITDPGSGFLEQSSSSSVIDTVGYIEPYVTAGVAMIEESSSSELMESSSSSSDPLISVDPIDYGPLSGEIVIVDPVTVDVVPLSSSSEASESSSSASDKKPVNE